MGVSGLRISHRFEGNSGVRTRSRLVGNVLRFLATVVVLYGLLLGIGLAVGAGFGTAALLGAAGLAILMTLPLAIASVLVVEVSRYLPDAARRPVTVVACGLTCYAMIVTIQAALDTGGPRPGGSNYQSLGYLYTFVPTLAGAVFGLVARLPRVRLEQ